MNHAVKETIQDYLLCIEIDPQPPDFVDKFDCPIDGHWRFWSDKGDRWPRYHWQQCPIAIGDTVNGRKVVGIEVELCGWCEDCKVWVIEEEHKDNKWLWNYKLKEIK